MISVMLGSQNFCHAQTLGLRILFYKLQSPAPFNSFLCHCYPKTHFVFPIKLQYMLLVVFFNSLKTFSL